VNSGTRTNGQTLPSLLTAAFSRRPERIALRDEIGSLTYGELDRRSNALANALLEFGLEPEGRVATILPNRLEAPIVDIATYKAGATRLPINPELSTTAIEYILSDAEPAVVVCDAARLDDVADLVDGLPTRPGVSPSNRRSRRHWRSAARLEDGAAADSPAVSVEPDAIAGHFYTGGTTGDPKGVCYTQSCLATNLLAHHADLGFSSTDTGLVATPISPSAGTFLLSALLAGGTVVLRRGFDETDFCTARRDPRRDVDLSRPDDALQAAGRAARGPRRVLARDVIYGAAPIRPDRLREALDRLGPVLTQFYGQTEVPNLITTLDRRDHARVLEDGDDRLLRSAGQPCLLSEVKVVDPDTGEERGPDEPGELLVRAPYTFDGYFGLPERRPTRRSSTAGFRPVTSAGSTTKATSICSTGATTSSSPVG